MKRTTKLTRPRVLGNSAREAVATGTSSGITGAVIVGLLPKIAAALSVIISAVQIFGMARRAWRKWRKGCKKRRARILSRERVKTLRGVMAQDKALRKRTKPYRTRNRAGRG